MPINFINFKEIVLKELKNIDIDNLTPVEALMKLHEIKRKIGLNK